MAPKSTVGGQGGSGKGLSRDLIVETGLRLIDRDGAQTLTMRSLAHELDVVPMALYRYVHGREDLLEGVVALLLEGVRRDLDDELAKGSWQGYLQTLANSVRSIVVDHAAAFPLVATRHPSAPWLRPPLRSLEVVQDFLHTLQSHGFRDRQAVDAYRAFSSFLLGQLLLEAAIRGAETAPVEVPLDEGDAPIGNEDADIDLDKVPDVARLRNLLSEDHADEEFQTALEALLDRLEMDLSQ